MTTQAHPSYRWLFWTLAVLGLVLDLGSKYVIFAALYDGGLRGRYPLVPGTFDLATAYTGEYDPGTDLLSPLRTLGGTPLPEKNEGALFGLGHGNNLFFLIVSLAAAAGITYWSTRPSAGREPLLNVALGLILAGTVGNLYDRIVFGGVRDFLDFYIGDWHWPTFNLADSCLVCGAGLLLLQAMFQKAHAAAEPQVVPAAEPNPEEVAEVR